MNEALKRLSGILDEAVDEIAKCEAEAVREIDENGNQAGFESWMIEKAEVLVSLPEKVRDAAEAVGGDLGAFVLDRVEQYSSSAETSLEINSPFFMSALLYPSSHQPGEPNNLELVAKRVREAL
jgi:hypothetical protein